MSMQSAWDLSLEVCVTKMNCLRTNIHADVSEKIFGISISGIPYVFRHATQDLQNIVQDLTNKVTQEAEQILKLYSIIDVQFKNFHSPSGLYL